MANNPTLLKIAEDVSWLRAKQEDLCKIYITKDECSGNRKECKNGKKLDWRWYATFIIAAAGLLLAGLKYFIP